MENKNEHITVLFTRKNSIYKKLGCNCYDITRNAKTWYGNEPIIAHPPCRMWGNFAHKAKGDQDEKWLTVWTVKEIRRNGGVMEHPSTSKIWQQPSMPQKGQKDEFGGWILNIDQRWFGHQAKKRTNLYIVGTEPTDIPKYPITLDRPTRSVEKMSKKQREETPEELAKWLIQLLQIIQFNKLFG